MRRSSSAQSTRSALQYTFIGRRTINAIDPSMYPLFLNANGRDRQPAPTWAYRHAYIYAHVVASLTYVYVYSCQNIKIQLQSLPYIASRARVCVHVFVCRKLYIKIQIYVRVRTYAYVRVSSLSGLYMYICRACSTCMHMQSCTCAAGQLAKDLQPSVRSSGAGVRREHVPFRNPF